jgi:hypothetical protein
MYNPAREKRFMVSYESDIMISEAESITTALLKFTLYELIEII